MADSLDDDLVRRPHQLERENDHRILLAGDNGGISDSAKPVNAIRRDHNGETEKQKGGRDKKSGDSYYLAYELSGNFDQEIAKVGQQLHTLEELRQLYKDGKLDYENHSDELNFVGLSKDDIEQNGENAFDQRQRELLYRLDKLEKGEEKYNTENAKIDAMDISEREKQRLRNNLDEETKTNVLHEVARDGNSSEAIMENAASRVGEVKVQSRGISLEEEFEGDALMAEFNMLALGEDLPDAENDEKYNHPPVSNTMGTVGP